MCSDCKRYILNYILIRRDMILCFSNPKISLIIPVYNVEKFLRTTLGSVFAQTFKDFEVIIVNDGSTDSSFEIIKEYDEKHDNMVVINQENQGQGIARNNALKVAKGEYVAFLDSDDFLEPDFLEELYKTATENDADISCCSFRLNYEKGFHEIFMAFTPRKSSVISSDEALKKLILDITMHHYLWNKLYKRSLFTENNIIFYDMFFEDIATCPKLFYYANKVAITNKCLYNYRRHKKSTIAEMDAVKINDFIKSLGAMRNFLEYENIYKEYQFHFKAYALRASLQVYFSILFEHIYKMNFNGMGTNLKNAYISIKLFCSNNYIPEINPPILPFYVKQPKNKRKKKKSTIQKA